MLSGNSKAPAHCIATHTAADKQVQQWRSLSWWTRQAIVARRPPPVAGCPSSTFNSGQEHQPTCAPWRGMGD